MLIKEAIACLCPGQREESEPEAVHGGADFIAGQ